MIGQAERLINLKNLEKVRPDLHDYKIISFTSGKGGTGKTFISLSVAYSLSKQNKRVLFIDLDFNFANANILLNIIPKLTINNFFRGNRLLNEVITEYDTGFHLIFGESGGLNYEDSALKEDQVSALFNQLNRLKQNYDFIIIDTPSGGQKGLISLLALSDICVIVASPEPTAVMDAYVMIKLLHKENCGPEKLIAINKCTDEEEALNAFNNIKSASEHFLKEKVEFLGHLEFDEKVYRSITKQEFLIVGEPSSKISIKLNKIAGCLAEKIESKKSCFIKGF
jgi:flagellar biosynthesis protein FlhG